MKNCLNREVLKLFPFSSIFETEDTDRSGNRVIDVSVLNCHCAVCEWAVEHISARALVPALCGTSLAVQEISRTGC